MSDYHRYLQGEHWQRLRAARLKWDGACAKCGRSDCRLDVHHLTYERLGHERFEDLRVLCRNCHEKHHFFGMPLTKTAEEEKLYQRQLEIGRTVDRGEPWD